MLHVAYGLDPCLLFQRTVGYEPDPWQQELLRCEDRQIVVLAARQVGKSTTLAVRVAHQLLYRAPAKVLIIGPSLFQALISFREVAATIIRAGRPLRYDRETRTELVLANGSSVIALPGSERTVRGLAGLDALIIDEAARISDELLPAVRPMIAIKGGSIIMASTPWARVGALYDTWTAGGDDWRRFEVPAALCPRLSDEFLLRERKALGDRAFSREYLCRFGSMRGNVFDEADLLRSVDRSLQPLLPEDEILEDHAWHSETYGAPHVTPLLSDSSRELAV